MPLTKSLLLVTNQVSLNLTSIIPQDGLSSHYRCRCGCLTQPDLERQKCWIAFTKSGDVGA
jgi:hypothetical protein